MSAILRNALARRVLLLLLLLLLLVVVVLAQRVHLLLLPNGIPRRGATTSITSTINRCTRMLTNMALLWCHGSFQFTPLQNLPQIHLLRRRRRRKAIDASPTAHKSNFYQISVSTSISIKFALFLAKTSTKDQFWSLTQKKSISTIFTGIWAIPLEVMFDFFGNVHIQIWEYHLLVPPWRGSCIGEVINGWKGSSARVHEFFDTLLKYSLKIFAHKHYHWTGFLCNLPRWKYSRITFCRNSMLWGENWEEARSSFRWSKKGQIFTRE